MEVKFFLTANVAADKRWLALATTDILESGGGYLTLKGCGPTIEDAADALTKELLSVYRKR